MYAVFYFPLITSSIIEYLNLHAILQFLMKTSFEDMLNRKCKSTWYVAYRYIVIQILSLFFYLISYYYSRFTSII